MRPYWFTILSGYLDKMIRSFVENELTGQKPSTSSVSFSLVTFNAHDPYIACIVQRSGWTREIDVFFQWLSAIPFSGVGLDDAAISEGLAEALMMFSATHGNQTQNVDGLRQCILVAASNPYPLPTSVYQPKLQNLDQSNSIVAQTESHLSDAETLAKSFAQCAISLSVICPKQLPKIRAIYNAGKRNPRAADLPVDTTKNPHFLVLISENFIEACAALSLSGVTNLASNQSPVKMHVTSVPPNSGAASVPSISGPTSTSIAAGMQPVGVNNNNSAANMPLNEQTSSTVNFAQSKYVKVWEGILSGQRQSQHVFITRLEGYRSASASETLAANWPPTMQIVRLISEDHMNNKQYVGKADFLVFRAMNQHGFLGQLQEKKLCAVIQLPLQTLLISVSDKACRLIGKLFPGVMQLQ
ncbi:Hypothetical predicted protein [Olea europaea subsp. europaea]|nr:Hypothetical predicted protein [Olea europaea subsp. europaea]